MSSLLWQTPSWLVVYVCQEDIAKVMFQKNAIY